MRQTISAAAYIGIDSGTNTGFALWETAGKHLIRVSSEKIHDAMELVLQAKENYGAVMVIVEDARQVRFKTDNAKAQGAGSVKRDAKIWEDFLTAKGVPFQMVRPNKKKTKWDAVTFNKITGWPAKSNEHGRDAAMLVFGK